jgi:hypothetical protein
VIRPSTRRSPIQLHSLYIYLSANSGCDGRGQGRSRPVCRRRDSTLGVRPTVSGRTVSVSAEGAWSEGGKFLCCVRHNCVAPSPPKLRANLSQLGASDRRSVSQAVGMQLFRVRKSSSSGSLWQPAANLSPRASARHTLWSVIYRDSWTLCESFGQCDSTRSPIALSSFYCTAP